MSMNQSIVDNWLLELASHLIGGPLNDESDDPKDYLRAYLNGYEARLRSAYHPRSPYDGYRGNKTAQGSRDDEVLALFQLLDLIVTSDELIYDPQWSNVWMPSGALTPVSSLLLPLRISKSREDIVASYDPLGGNLDGDRDTPTIVEEGARYYLALSRTIGAYYWPAPRRAEFLARAAYAPVGPTFVLQLKEAVDESLNQIVSEVLDKIKIRQRFLKYFSFASPVLSSCDSRETILKTGMQFRETKECKAFRKWLRDVDTALEQGNIKIVAEAMRDVNDVLQFVRSGLKLDDKKDSKIDFQIGLSPSIKLSGELLPSLIKRFKPKPYHVAFLRHHYSSVLANTNASYQIKRLFPDLI